MKDRIDKFRVTVDEVDDPYGLDLDIPNKHEAVFTAVADTPDEAFIMVIEAADMGNFDIPGCKGLDSYQLPPPSGKASRYRVTLRLTVKPPPLPQQSPFLRYGGRQDSRFTSMIPPSMT